MLLLPSITQELFVTITDLFCLFTAGSVYSVYTAPFVRTIDLPHMPDKHIRRGENAITAILSSFSYSLISNLLSQYVAAYVTTEIKTLLVFKSE